MKVPRRFINSNACSCSNASVCMGCKHDQKHRDNDLKRESSGGGKVRCGEQGGENNPKKSQNYRVGGSPRRRQCNPRSRPRRVKADSLSTVLDIVQYCCHVLVHSPRVNMAKNNLFKKREEYLKIWLPPDCFGDPPHYISSEETRRSTFEVGDIRWKFDKATAPP